MFLLSQKEDHLQRWSSLLAGIPLQKHDCTKTCQEFSNLFFVLSKTILRCRAYARQLTIFVCNKQTIHRAVHNRRALIRTLKWLSWKTKAHARQLNIQIFIQEQLQVSQSLATCFTWRNSLRKLLAGDDESVGKISEGLKRLMIKYMWSSYSVVLSSLFGRRVPSRRRCAQVCNKTRLCYFSSKLQREMQWSDVVVGKCKCTTICYGADSSEDMGNCLFRLCIFIIWPYQWGLTAVFTSSLTSLSSHYTWMNHLYRVVYRWSKKCFHLYALQLARKSKLTWKALLAI